MRILWLPSTGTTRRRQPFLGLYLLATLCLPVSVWSFQTSVHTTTRRFSSCPTVRTRRFVKEQQQSDVQPPYVDNDASNDEPLASEVFTPSPNDPRNDIVASVDPDVVHAIENEEPDELDDTEECLLGTEQSGKYCIPLKLVSLPRHSHVVVNKILMETERTLCEMHVNRDEVDLQQNILEAKEQGRSHERIYANNYVDLGNIDTIGFDYDYTLVTYTEELLALIYKKALERLVNERQYPIEMLQSGLHYDPFFSIRGLAVDKETGWITHLSYTHKVAVAWEGRKKLPTSRIFAEYRGKRALTPNDRKKRLKPLNDLFSLAECCLISDVIQFFKDRDIPFGSQNVVTDVLNAVTSTHLSGEFHRLVAQNPELYFEPTPHLKDVLSKLKQSGKRLIFVSNSPFWYVDAGMKYVLGDTWREEWDAIITSTLVLLIYHCPFGFVFL